MGATTYVVAALAAVVTLLQYIMIFLGAGTATDTLEFLLRKSFGFYPAYPAGNAGFFFFHYLIRGKYFSRAVK